MNVNKIYLRTHDLVKLVLRVPLAEQYVKE